MGGKQKQGQRTKGNQKPSSSARAAELLEASGASAAGFLGFGKVGCAAVDTDEAEYNYDSDLALVLKKLTKRDSTTKLKALQEFGQLCQEKDVDAVTSVLQYWPKIFVKMSSDNDHRVREATHEAFEQLILKVRRSLAPHLKVLLGPWLVSQCDSYAPAATAAKTAFTSAFSPAKQIEAIGFCKMEILLHFEDSLLKQTLQNAADGKMTEPEEVESKYFRLVGSSLEAFALFISLLAEEQQEAVHDKLCEILKSSKFWKYGKHTIGSIRSGFFNVLSNICQYYPRLATEFADQISPAVLYNLDESHPCVVSSLWHAVLQVISTIKDCWSKVNLQKGVFPKLWSMLKSGGNGCAVSSHPNLLPFLDFLPTEIKFDDGWFFNQFMSNLKAGLAINRIGSRECNAIVEAFVECIRYYISQHLSSSDSKQAKIELIVCDQILPVFEASLVEDSSVLSNSNFYNVLIDLLTYVQKFSITENKVETFGSSLYCCLMDKISLKVFEMLHGSSDVVLSRLSIFFESFLQTKVNHLENDSKILKKSRKSVSFQSSDVKEIGESCSTPVGTEVVVRLKMDDAVRKLVYESCVISLNRSKESLLHLKFLTRIFQMFVEDGLLQTLVLSSNMESSSSNARINFMDVIIFPWLISFNKEISPSASYLTTIMLAVIKMLEKNEKLSTLKRLMELLENSPVLFYIIRLLISSNCDPVIRNWLSSAEFGKFMVGLSEDLCQERLKSSQESSGNEDDEKWKLFCLVLSTDSQGEAYVYGDHMVSVLCVIRDALPTGAVLCKLDVKAVHQRVQFMCDVTAHLFTNLKICATIPSSKSLLLSLFEFNLHSNLVSGPLHDKLHSTWQQGFAVTLTQEGFQIHDESLLSQSARLLESAARDDMETVTRLTQLVEIGCRLVDIIYKCCPDDENNNSVGAFLRKISFGFDFSRLTSWQEFVIISHKVLVSSLDFTETKATTLAKIPQSVGPVALYCHLVCKIIVDSSEVGGTKESVAEEMTDDIGAAGEGNTIKEGIISDEDVINETRKLESKEKHRILLPDIPHMMDLCLGIAFCSTVSKDRSESHPKLELIQALSLMKQDFGKLYNLMVRADKEKLIQAMFDQSLMLGGLWSIALHELLKHLHCSGLAIDCFTAFGGLNMVSHMTESVILMLQNCFSFMNTNEVEQIMEIAMAQIMSCEKDESIIGFSESGMTYLAVFNSALALQEFKSARTNDLVLVIIGQIQAWRDRHDLLFLYNVASGTFDWPLVSLNIEIIYFFKLVVSKQSTSLASEHWDMILCTMVSWLQVVWDNRSQLFKNFAVQSFSATTFDLISQVAVCMDSVLPEQPSAFPASLSSEWKELFSSSVFDILFPLYVEVSDQVSKEFEILPQLDSTLHHLCSAVVHCSKEHLLQHKLEVRLVADEDSNLSDDIQTFLNTLCPLLLSNQRCIQLAAYQLLLKVITELASFDEGKPAKNVGSADADICRSPPRAIVSTLGTSWTGFAADFDGIAFGTLLVPSQFTETYTSVMGYLLSCNLLLKFFIGATSELRAEYAQWLRQQNTIGVLIKVIFSIAPPSPVVPLKECLVFHSSTSSSNLNLFSQQPSLNVEKDLSAGLELQHVACMVYLQTLQTVPAMLRQWWNDQDKRIAGLVDKFTASYVSPILISREMAMVNSMSNTLTGMTVKARTASREVIATYSVDETSSELVITLPANLPFGQIEVETGKRVGVNKQQWRKWQLQLIMFLTYQNGSIVDGLSLWKQNIDKRFEDIEDCMICFSVIHGSNCSLPRLQCKTCKKRFHDVCLYKWFKTSLNSACPLCRNAF